AIRQLDSAPAGERYRTLHDWTMPGKDRRSVRILASPAPRDVVPEVFWGAEAATGSTSGRELLERPALGRQTDAGRSGPDGSETGRGTDRTDRGLDRTGRGLDQTGRGTEPPPTGNPVRSVVGGGSVRRPDPILRPPSDPAGGALTSTAAALIE